MNKDAMLPLLHVAEGMACEIVRGKALIRNGTLHQVNGEWCVMDYRFVPVAISGVTFTRSGSAVKATVHLLNA